MLGFLLVLKQPLFPNRQEWLPVTLVGLVSTALNFAAMFLSPDRIGAGIASVVGNTQPLIAVILAVIFLGERITQRKFFALILGMVGVTLITYPAFTGPTAYGTDGSILGLLVSVSSAVGSILVKRLVHEANLLTVASWQLLLGSLPLLAVSLWAESSIAITWSVSFILVLLFLAVVGTSFVTFVWYALLQRSEVGQVSLFLFFTPLLGFAIGALAFNERVGLVQIVGVLSTLIGLGLLSQKASLWER